MATMSRAVCLRKLNPGIPSLFKVKSHFCWTLTLIYFLIVTPAVLAQSNPPFVNPRNIEYKGGVIDVTAAPASVAWSGMTVNTNVYSAKYNGQNYPASYTPPTIRINPDQNNTLNLKLWNHIGTLNQNCVEEHDGFFTNDPRLT